MGRNRDGIKEIRRRLASERGVALLMVLWILTILMVIVLSFTFMARTETHGTLYFKEGAEKKFLAEAGVTRGIMEIFYRGWYKNQPDTLEGSEVVKVDGTKYMGKLGNDYYIYSVLDESGKLNLNLLSDISGIILNNMLVKRGVPKEQADTIVDSILDWMDTDENHRLHGAESDYYMTLPNPYKARNDKFEAVEELLLVKGMTPAILYGDGVKPGIDTLLTVNSKTGGINLNTAPKEVIAALPGLTTEMADQIISLRGAGEIKDLESVKTALGEAYKPISSYVGLTESNMYTIESAGYKRGGKQGLEVKITVEIQDNGKYRCIYYKSPAGTRRAPAEG
jgi:general secretion pathway protein K